MILKMELKNFMGFNRTVSFGMDTVLSGRNGSHKTTILNAIAFALCGTDAWGTAAPVFMISNETDKMEVIMTTSKTTIHRTLTRKKSSNLKIKINEVWATLNQTQMNEFIGPTQHVLSVINPQFFFSLTHDRQKQLLASILPKKDRADLVVEMLGRPISEFDALTIKTRDPLRAATVFAERRREAERNKAVKEGHVQRIMENITKAQDSLKTFKFAPVSMVQEFEVLDKEKIRFNLDNYSYLNCLSLYKSSLERRDSRVAEIGNAAQTDRSMIPVVETKLKEIALELEAADKSHKNAQDLAAKALAAFREAQDARPQKPASLLLPEGEFCGSCGQPVSKRYREKVIEDLRKTQEEYERSMEEYTFKKNQAGKVCEDVEAQVSKTLARWSELMDLKRTSEYNLEKLKERLDWSAAEIQKLEATGLEKPIAPEKTYSEERWEELNNALSTLEPASTKLKLEEEIKNATLELDTQYEEISNFEEAIKLTGELEEACKAIPEKEMELAAKYLNLEGFTIDLETSGLLISEDGVPYISMSTGQKMCAEISLALHINSICQKTNLMFLDNFELVDVTNADKLRSKLISGGLQIIQTKVTNDDFKEEWA